MAIIGREIVRLESAGSTNDVALERGRQGAAEGLVVTGCQSARPKSEVASRTRSQASAHQDNWTKPPGCRLIASGTGTVNGVRLVILPTGLLSLISQLSKNQKVPEVLLR